ncbi:hypothetical protein LTR95_007129 [Oleoguttula sp. CCFEE 5521]
MDLASVESVTAGAVEFFRHDAPLDILIANPGVMALPPGLNADGDEVQFGTNHMITPRMFGATGEGDHSFAL